MSHCGYKNRPSLIAAKKKKQEVVLIRNYNKTAAVVLL